MSSASPQVESTTPAPAAALAASQPSTAPVAADKPKATQRAVDATAATAVTQPTRRTKAAKLAKPAKSAPAIAAEATPPAAVTKSRRAKPAPVPAPATPAPAAAKPAKPAASVKAGAKADVKPKPAPKPGKLGAAKTDTAKPLRVKEKLVRDSFTMPSADFALIHQLKERALGFKRATKKSELLRAGLQALAALSDTQLQALLGKLTAIKAGRPKKVD